MSNGPPQATRPDGGPPGGGPHGGGRPGGPPSAGPGGAFGVIPPGFLLPQRRKVLIMLTVMLSLFLAALDQTIWNVAAPKAVGDLGNLDLFAWPATSYLLGSTVMVPIIGKLSDVYGRKPFLLVGVVVFIFSSALCGAAGTMYELIGFRLLQGFGAAFIMANAFTVMGDYFAPAERGRWAGVVAGVFAMASIIGPLAGGVLTDELSWRWVFYINIPVGGLALLSIIFFMPWHKPDHGPQRQPTDWAGASLLILAATPLLLALSLGDTEVAGRQVGWLDSPVIIPLIVTAAATVLFWRVGRRKGNDGIMPLPMFQNRVYLLCTLVMFVIGVAMMGAMFALPFFLQGAQGVSATNSGLVTLPSSLGIVPASIITGQIMSRTGQYKPVAVVGATGAMISLFMLSTLDVDSSLNEARLYMFIMGASMGTLMPLYTLLLQNALPFQLLGAGTSANQFFRQIGMAAGIAVFGSLIVSGFSSELTKSFPQGMEQLKESPEVLLAPDRLAVLAAQLDEVNPGSSEMVIGTAREALGNPVTDVFRYGSFAMAGAIIIALLLPRVQFRTQEEMMAAARAAGGGGPPDRPHARPPGAPPVTPSAAPSREPVPNGRTNGALARNGDSERGNGLRGSAPMIATWAHQRPKASTVSDEMESR